MKRIKFCNKEKPFLGKREKEKNKFNYSTKNKKKLFRSSLNSECLQNEQNNNNKYKKRRIKV